ncbi:MAG: hypothetical protein WCF26_20700 [Candidatus Sulfotelmatobacter sp.]
MSASITPAAAPFPPLPFLCLEKAKRDAETQAVLRYLEAAGGVEQARAFDRLVGFCYHAVQPYFLRDRHGSLKAENIPQFDSIEGKRTGYAIRNEGRKHDVTREWIQLWLLKFLAPYLGQSHREIVAAANAGEFRYLGLWCRQALKNLVYRQHKREANEQFTGLETATENLGTNELGESSPLRAHAPFDQTAAAVNDARRVVMANAGSLEELDLLTGLLAYLSVAEHVTEPHFEGRVTKAIMDMLGVKERGAQDYKRKYHETVGRELEARNPALQAISKELTPKPLSFVVSTDSDEEGEDNRRLLWESRQLMAEYATDCAKAA